MTESRTGEPQEPRGIAVVGAGRWGINHVRVFDELGSLGVVCDADPLRLEALAPTYPQATMTPIFEEAIAHPAVSGVVLATPARTHATLAAKAIDAGKDVLVEKPLALTFAEARELRDRATGQGVVLTVGHVLEYHPAVRRLHELVRSGDLGRIRYLYSNRLNFGTIRSEENVLWSFAPHDIAVMLRIMGRSPETVACAGGSYLDPDVADSTLTAMTFPGGVRAHIYVSWLHPFKEQRFVVIGDQRMAVFDDTAPWPEKLVTYEHAVVWEQGHVPIARKVAGESVTVDEDEPLRVQAQAFLEAIRTRRPPLVTSDDAVAVLQILNAAQRSLDGSGAPVPLQSQHAESDFHPTATIDPGALIGEGTKVWHHAHVMTDAVIGPDCTLGQNVFVGRGVRIGAGCKLQNNVSIFEGVTLEDEVFCGPSVVFTNVKTPRAAVDRRDAFTPTLVRHGATIGANATIICGTTVGRYAFVAAASTVTSDVPNHALVLGSPAKVHGWICQCGERLLDTDEPRCAACGARYVKGDDGLRETSS